MGVAGDHQRQHRCRGCIAEREADVLGERKQGDEEQREGDADHAVLDEVEAQAGEELEAQDAHQGQGDEQHAVLQAPLHQPVEIDGFESGESHVDVAGLGDTRGQPLDQGVLRRNAWEATGELVNGPRCREPCADIVVVG